MSTTLTSAEAVAGVLRQSATDPVFLHAWKAAERWIARRCRWTSPAAAEDLQQAVILLTGRYMARRNSPDGLVGMGDLGAMRVSAIDRDVQSLTGPYRRVVL